MANALMSHEEGKSTLERVDIPVTGMTCAACQSFVQRTLQSEAGVQDASVNLMLHRAAVTFDPRVVSASKLVETIRGTGYGAELPVFEKSVLDTQEKHDEEQRSEYRRLRLKAAVSLVAGAVAMIVSMPLMSMNSVGGMERMKDPFLNWSMRVLDPALRKALPWMYSIDASIIRWFLFALAALVAGWAGRHFYIKAWSALLHKTADMNTLIALGATAAWVSSMVAAIRYLAGDVHHAELYFEAGASIVTFVMVFLVGAFGMNFPIFASTIALEFGQQADGYGLLSSMLAIGSLAGALLSARRDRARMRVVIVAAGGFGAMSLVSSFMPAYAAYAAMLVLVGFCTVTMLTTANGYVQTTTDPGLRGRVLALYMAVIMGATPIGAPIVGWVATVLGPRSAIQVGAVAGLLACVIGTAWVIASGRLHRDQERRFRLTIDETRPLHVVAAQDLPART